MPSDKRLGLGARASSHEINNASAGPVRAIRSIQKAYPKVPFKRSSDAVCAPSYASGAGRLFMAHRQWFGIATLAAACLAGCASTIPSPVQQQLGRRHPPLRWSSREDAPQVISRSATVPAVPIRGTPYTAWRCSTCRVLLAP